jgi:hypothetical protein
LLQIATKSRRLEAGRLLRTLGLIGLGILLGSAMSGHGIRPDRAARFAIEANVRWVRGLLLAGTEHERVALAERSAREEATRPHNLVQPIVHDREGVTRHERDRVFEGWTVLQAWLPGGPQLR